MGKVNSNMPNEISLKMSKTRGLKQHQQDFNDNYINLNNLHLLFTRRDFAPLDLKCHGECMEEY